jgi:hypothetical protein
MQPVPDAPPEELPVEAPAPAPPAWLAKVRPALPWLSLGMGVVSALILDRRPARAWTVPTAVGAAWTLMTVMLLLHRDEAGTRRPLVRAARFSSLALTQSAFQMTLFFVGPLYWHAAAPTAGHVVFLALLGVAAGCSLWDPLFQRMLRQPALGIPLLALAGFAGLCATLPFFGVATATSLRIAAAATGLAAPVVAGITGPAAGRRRSMLTALALGALLNGGVWVGGGALVPAAPLRVVEAGIGTRIAGRELTDPRESLDAIPPQLVCATTVWAPLGLHDRLVHVWRHEGTVEATVGLDLHGGREQGFRTWSTKQHLKPGAWTCTVETAAGQVLARRRVTIAR